MSKKNILRAVKAHDSSALKTQLDLLKVKEKTSHRKKEFMDVLNVAVSEGDVNCTKELVEAYTDWYTYKYSGNPPMLQAAKCGHRDVIEVLIKSGADIETVDKAGNIALAIACKFGRCHVVKYLLSLGAQVNANVEGGKTVLMSAVQDGHLEVVKILLDEGHADLHAVTNTNDSALMYLPGDAAEIADLLFMRGSLVNDRNDTMETALVSCLKHGGKMNLDLLDCLLTNHANVNIPDKYGQTPLMVAIAYSQSDEIIQRLVSEGAEVNASNHRGTTPLEYAVRRDRPEVIKVLVDAGVNLNTTDVDGNSALMVAFLKNCSVETLHLLIDQGIDVNIQNKDEETAVSWGVRRYSYYMYRCDVFMKLLNAGADLSLAGIDGSQLLTLDLNNYKWVEERPNALFRSGIWVTYQLHLMIIRRKSCRYTLALSYGAMPRLWCVGPEPVPCSTIVPSVIRNTPVSPVFTAFLSEDIDFARKLLDMNFLNVFDLRWPDDLRSALMTYLECRKNRESLALIRCLYDQPWSLFTLCFVKISTRIGFEPDRPKKLSQTGLPTFLQRKLMFGTQVLKS